MDTYPEIDDLPTESIVTARMGKQIQPVNHRSDDPCYKIYDTTLY